MTGETRPPAWKTVLAFAIIYLVWGSTFLAIRVGVREVPPLILAAMRFAAAGAAIYFWLIARGEKSPSAREWISASLLGIVIFVFDYGLLFWAEQRVPSGIAAVILATIPVFMTLSEIIFLRTQRLTARLALALLIGIGGVALLMIRSLDLGGAPVDKWGAMALIFAAISWSIASAVTRMVPLPKSKAMSSGAQMLSGGIFLAIAAALTGEYRNFHPSMVSREVWLSLLYLIVAGSIIAYTAFVWLLHYQSPTKVGTYAYVNPIVAVMIGYFWGGEGLSARTVLGSLLILVSVVVITTMRGKKVVVERVVEVASESAAS
jgi:drug/metabolite transporter (DMT)-like permease